MIEIRKVEELLIRLSNDKKIPGTLHSCIGQEAVAAGVCGALKKSDVVFSTHRGHGHALAKGITPKELIFELAGREDGLCKGLGGSQHLASVEKGFYANGITGGMVPIAVGMALGFKKRKEDRAVAVFFGDGALGQGVIYEAANMASLWDLPILFVCENNQYGMSARIDQTIASSRNITERFKSFGIHSFSRDGNSVVFLYDAVNTWRQQPQLKPFFLECKTYRIAGHSKNDPEKYRSKEEVQAWREKDPIKQARIPDEEYEEASNEIDRELEEIVACLK